MQHWIYTIPVVPNLFLATDPFQFILKPTDPYVFMVNPKQIVWWTTLTFTNASKL